MQLGLKPVTKYKNETPLQDCIARCADARVIVGPARRADVRRLSAARSGQPVDLRRIQ